MSEAAARLQAALVLLAATSDDTADHAATLARFNRYLESGKDASFNGLAYRCLHEARATETIFWILTPPHLPTVGSPVRYDERDYTIKELHPGDSDGLPILAITTHL